MIRHRFATAADLDKFYDERPEQTVRAIVIEMDDEPVAIIGIARHRDRFQAFSEYKPALEPHLKSMPVLRAIKAGQQLIKEAPLPVIAIEEGKPGFLSRLGFNEVSPGVYLWAD